MAKLIVHNPPTVKLKASGYTGTPTGDIELTENNKTYNVSPFATATTAIPEEEKTVTPSTAEQVITPDEGLLKKVTVNPTPLEEKTVTPTTEQQTIVPQLPAIGFSQIIVNPVPPAPVLIKKQITENGTYTAADDNADGFSEVTVDVPDESYFLPNCVMYKRNMVFPSTITSFFTTYRTYANAEYLERVDLSNISPNISFPQAMFVNCQNLKEIIFNNSMTYIPIQICLSCNNLGYTVIPNSVSEFRNQCFGDCPKLKLDLSLFIDPSSLPTLANTFTLSREVVIYVANQEMLDAFSTATNWSTYADRFQIKGATP